MAYETKVEIAKKYLEETDPNNAQENNQATAYFKRTTLTGEEVVELYKRVKKEHDETIGEKDREISDQEQDLKELKEKYDKLREATQAALEPFRGLVKLLRKNLPNLYLIPLWPLKLLNS